MLSMRSRRNSLHARRAMIRSCVISDGRWHASKDKYLRTRRLCRNPSLKPMKHSARQTDRTAQPNPAGAAALNMMWVGFIVPSTEWWYPFRHSSLWRQHVCIKRYHQLICGSSGPIRRGRQWVLKLINTSDGANWPILCHLAQTTKERTTHKDSKTNASVFAGQIEIRESQQIVIISFKIDRHNYSGESEANS